MQKKYVLISLYILLGIAIALGIAFRFTNLDGHVFWRDEACTLLRISGYAEVDFLQKFSFDRIAQINDIQQFQQLHSSPGLTGTIQGLATEEPQLSPLYFVLLYFWIQRFGDSIEAIRLLSVLSSLLLLPALFWLGRELFKTPLPIWILLGLVAVSPTQLAYAQEARPYSFWLLTFTLSNAAFLQAVRRNQRIHWAVYAILTSLSIYTYLLSGLSLLAHSLYIYWYERTYHSKRLLNGVASFSTVILLSSWWLFIVVSNLISIPQLKSNQERLGLLTGIRRVIGGVRSTFFDLNSDKNNADFYVFGIDPNLILNFAILALILYCSYLLVRHLPRHISVFIIILTLSSSVLLILSGKYLPRYLLTFYLTLQIIVAYGLANRIGTAINKWRSVRWFIVLASLISIGILACTVNLQKETSWIKNSARDIQVASVINNAARPLVVSDTNPCMLMTLSHYLDSKVSLQIEPSCGICTAGSATFKRPDRVPNIPKEFDQVFLFSPSPRLLDDLKKVHTVQMVARAGLDEGLLYLVTD